MNGVVNAEYEATLPVLVYGPGGKQKAVTAVVDTGYNGALSLPLAAVQDLQLLPHLPRVVTLGDRSQTILDFYQAEVFWDGQRRPIRVLCVEGDPLLGTALLKGYALFAHFVDGGPVAVSVP